MKHFILVLVMFSLMACSAQSHLINQQWHEIETDHFRILTDSDKDDVVELAKELEKFRLAVAALSNSRLYENKLTIFAVGSDLSYRGLVDSKLKKSKGAFQATTYKDYAVVNMNRDVRYFKVNSSWARQYLFHEYTHYLLSIGIPIDYPYWYSEGYAELLSTLKFEEDNIIFGEMPVYRAYSLVNDKAMDLETLLTARRDDDLSDKEVSQIYASGWLLTHMLAGGNYIDGMNSFLDSLAQGKDPVIALEENFSTSVEEMNTRLKAYSEEGIPSYGIAYEPGFPDTIPTVKVIKKQNVISQLGQLYALSNDSVESILSLIKLLDKEDDNIDLNYSLAMAYLNEDNLDKANEVMDLQSFDKPDSLWPLFVKANWLLDKAEEQPEGKEALLTEAYYIYKGLLESGEDNSLIWYGIGMSASQLKSKPEVYTDYFRRAYYLNKRNKQARSAYFEALAESKQWQELVMRLQGLIEHTVEGEEKIELERLLEQSKGELSSDS